MVLKATVHKESPKQSLPNVTSEEAVRRCFNYLYRIYFVTCNKTSFRSEKREINVEFTRHKN